MLIPFCWFSSRICPSWLVRLPRRLLPDWRAESERAASPLFGDGLLALTIGSLQTSLALLLRCPINTNAAGGGCRG